MYLSCYNLVYYTSELPDFLVSFPEVGVILDMSLQKEMNTISSPGEKNSRV